MFRLAQKLCIIFSGNDFQHMSLKLIRWHFISLWLILNYPCSTSPSKISLVAHNEIQSTYQVRCVIKPNWKHKRVWQFVQIYAGFMLWGFTPFCLSTNHSWNNPKWSKPWSRQYHLEWCEDARMDDMGPSPFMCYNGECMETLKRS